jgi:hypothetical protein
LIKGWSFGLSRSAIAALCGICAALRLNHE